MIKAITRIFNAFGYSLQGLTAAFNREVAFKQEAAVACVAIIVLVILELPLVAKAIMFFSVMLIFITELANTAIEILSDEISKHKHPMIKQAKDIGSALVLLAIVNAIVVWCLLIFF